MTQVVFSPGRAQQLRSLLWAAVVLAAACLALALFVAVAGGSLRFAAFLAVPASVLVPSAMLTLRAMEQPGPGARIGSLLTGGLLIVVGLLLASAVVGILPSIVGILLLLLALLPARGEEQSPPGHVRCCSWSSTSPPAHRATSAPG